MKYSEALNALEKWGIHRQRFHQQVKTAAFVFKNLMGIIGAHEAKLKHLPERMHI